MTCQNFYSRINRTPIIFTKTHADMSNIILNLIETDPPQCIQKFAVISQDFHSFSCNDRISLQRQLLFRATPKQGQNQIKIQKSVIEIRNVSPNFLSIVSSFPTTHFYARINFFASIYQVPLLIGQLVTSIMNIFRSVNASF